MAKQSIKAGTERLRKIKESLPSHEELKARRLRYLEECPWLPHTGNFNFLSLLAWLEQCKKYNIPHIPGHSIYNIEIKKLWEMADGIRNDECTEMFQMVRKIVNKTNMVRYDCCASNYLKWALSDHGTAELNERYLDSGSELRLFDILYEWAPETVDIVLRPWVKAKFNKKWPVEFRVFAQDGEIIGVSNYYPQRNLPKSYERIAKKAMKMAEPFLQITPSFSADFLLTENNELLFLEGGPPHHVAGGAHMCCFLPGMINGVCLEKQFIFGNRA